MDLDPFSFQRLNGCPDIHRVPPQPVNLGDNYDITRLKLVEQLTPAQTL